jgi:hypothetical protein
LGTVFIFFSFYPQIPSYLKTDDASEIFPLISLRAEEKRLAILGQDSTEGGGH